MNIVDCTSNVRWMFVKCTLNIRRIFSKCTMCNLVLCMTSVMRTMYTVHCTLAVRRTLYVGYVTNVRWIWLWRTSKDVYVQYMARHILRFVLCMPYTSAYIKPLYAYNIRRTMSTTYMYYAIQRRTMYVVHVHHTLYGTFTVHRILDSNHYVRRIVTRGQHVLIITSI